MLTQQPYHKLLRNIPGRLIYYFSNLFRTTNWVQIKITNFFDISRLFSSNRLIFVSAELPFEICVNVKSPQSLGCDRLLPDNIGLTKLNRPLITSKAFPYIHLIQMDLSFLFWIIRKSFQSINAEVLTPSQAGHRISHRNHWIYQ